MKELAHTVAGWFQFILPDWIRVPSLTFELPHALYWGGLIVFPLIAMYLVQRARADQNRERISLPIAWLLWLWGGFAGMHRFYLRGYRTGFAYVAFFLLALYGNKQATAARNVASEAQNTVKDASFQVEHYTAQLARGRDSAAERLDQAKALLEKAQTDLVTSASELDRWQAFAGGFALIIVLMLIYDAFVLPRLKARAQAAEANMTPPAEFVVMERGVKGDARSEIHTPFTRAVDAISGWSGRFVCFWAVLAVFVYYYEVIARYVFNSPTNWAHESMFLMFGMQYLVSGAYAYRDEAHVRVDVIYEKFSIRGRAIADVVTSFFFFVFTISLLVTGFIFARDSALVLEVSFTEWAIQYWPVKIVIALGAALLLLQGLARLNRDLAYLVQSSRAGEG